jgi:hypothetical protein
MAQTTLGGRMESRRNGGRDQGAPEGAWLESSDRRRDAEIGRQGKRGTINQGGLCHQVASARSPLSRSDTSAICRRFPAWAAVRPR